jgi:cyclopropane fatty-acyl-phospholipid synthase-like methyltransferase
VIDLVGRATEIAAIAALERLGVLEELAGRPATAADLASELDLDPGAVRRALEVARALGFLTEAHGVYRACRDHTASAAEVLGLVRAFPEHLRRGTTFTKTTRDREALYERATPGLGERFGACAETLAEILAERLAGSRCEAILDVGAGSGVWSLAMAARHDQALVTALDLEPVLRVFRERADDAHHACLAADYHHVALEPRWDRVILANVLHLEAPTQARALLARAATWKRAAGAVIVVDTLLRTSRSARSLASYECHLALRVHGARVYEAEEIASWGRELDLEVAASIELEPESGLGALVLR